MNRRNLLIGIVIIIIAGTIAGVFFLLNRNPNINDGFNENRDVFLFEETNSDLIVNQEDEEVDEIISEEDLDDEEKMPELRRISAKAVSGYGLFDENGTTTIRFVDTESGNIFETNSKTLDINRVTNRTILQTIDSFWLDKDTVLIRYVDENGKIQSFSAKIIKEEGVQFSDLAGSFMEEGIENLDVSNSGIFALSRNSSGSLGTVYDMDLETEDFVLNTPLREIFGSWAGNNLVSINTKPSSQSAGFMFLLNTNTEALDLVLSEIPGLYANVSKETGNIIYSSSDNRGVSLWFADRENGGVRKVSQSTLAEKCVWADFLENIVYCAVPKNLSFRNLPDEWYKGNVSFSDNIWMINLETNESELIMNLENFAGDIIDVVNIKISENGDYLAFTNKRDVVLWLLSLPEEN